MIIKALKYIIILVGMATFSTYAIYIDSTIYDMPSDKNFISKRIYNDSSKQNLYSISAVKIDKPGPTGERRRSIVDGEVIFSPLSFSLTPESGKIFKIFYRGPKDDIERYYRIQYTEMPTTVFSDRKTGKESNAFPVIVLDTILVIRPRNIKFNYILDEDNGVIKNTGNTFFKLIIHKDCNSIDDKANMLYILPGETWKSKELNIYNKKFIVALHKFTPIGKGCFNLN